MTPPALKRHGIAVNEDGIARSCRGIARLSRHRPRSGSRRSGRISLRLAPEIAEQLEIDARYAGYLERQERDIAAFRRDEALLLPADLDYAAVGSLSREICDKLAAGPAGDLGRGGADLRGDPGGAGRAVEACEAACGMTTRRR